MTNVGPTLETERLLLRVPEAGDFERFAAMLADPSSVHIGGPVSRHDAWRRFLQMPGAWMLQGFAMFAVVEKASGKWIGNIGPWQPEGWPGTEVGWALHRDAWGKGYALEAATAAIDWAFANLGWSDVIHSIGLDNSASQALAQRLGSRNRGRGTLPAPFQHVVIDIWGQTREAWFARRNGSAA